MPQIVLQQQGHVKSEWDTIVTRIYNPGYTGPVISDTFIATKGSDLLQIIPVADSLKDFEILLPATGKVYKLYNIYIVYKQTDVRAGEVPECYHDISCMLDDRYIQASNSEKLIGILYK